MEYWTRTQFPVLLFDNAYGDDPGLKTAGDTLLDIPDYIAGVKPLLKHLGG